MSLALNDEQQMLKTAAREFFSEKQPVSALRQRRDANDPTGFDRAAWAAMSELGWPGILIPEAHGGVDFGYQGLGQLMEEAGRTLAASPLVSTVLLCGPLVRALGTPAQQAEILPAIAAGTRIMALALDEGAHHDPLTSACRAIPGGRGFMLAGAKTMVLDGHVADELLVLARTAGQPGEASGLSLFRVPVTAAGLECRRLSMVDSRNAAAIHFNDVEVDADALLGPLHGALPALESVLDAARAGLAAEMLGSAQEAFDRTLNYLRLRVQFGVPIGSFQALKHRAALMFCELELTRSAVRAALAALDANDPESALLACLAKAKANDTAELVSAEAVQMHGGIGMTDAEEIGLFLKRARVAQYTLGDSNFQRARYARLRGY